MKFDEIKGKVLRQLCNYPKGYRAVLYVPYATGKVTGKYHQCPL